jgi:hypothetical protein
VWIYVIATGELWRRRLDGTSNLVGAGYAGHGAGVNNPALIPERKIGPLPPGWYEIGPAYHHPRLGALTFNLTPDPHTEMFGRDLFRIHGDNKLRNRSGSYGCIVQDRPARNILHSQRKHDARLHVVVTREEEGLNL